MPKSQKPKKQSKKVDYEELGKMLENIYESGYVDHNRAYKTSFFKGVVSGFGGVLGATVLVGLVLWILSLLGHVPLLDRVVNNIRQTVQSQHR